MKKSGTRAGGAPSAGASADIAIAPERDQVAAQILAGSLHLALVARAYFGDQLGVDLVGVLPQQTMAHRRECLSDAARRDGPEGPSCGERDGPGGDADRARPR